MREERGKERQRPALERERARMLGVVSRVFIWFPMAGIIGEDFNRIFISFAGVSFHGCGLYQFVSTRESEGH